jgi:citrate synthase
LAGRRFDYFEYQIYSIVPGSPDNVPAFLEAVKKREKVLSGFGHR